MNHTKLITILYWMIGGTNIVPYWPPSPIPIPSVSKSLPPGGKQNSKRHILMISNDLYGLFFFKSLINHLETNKSLISGDGWNKY